MWKTLPLHGFGRAHLTKRELAEKDFPSDCLFEDIYVNVDKCGILYVFISHDTSENYVVVDGLDVEKMSRVEVDRAGDAGEVSGERASGGVDFADFRDDIEYVCT